MPPPPAKGLELMMPSIAHAPPPAASAADLPVLDLSPLLAGEDIDGLAFFYIRNHGIPTDVIEGAFAASRRFFEQPLDARMKIHKDRFHRGYLPLGTTRYPGKAADLKDSFDLGVDLPQGGDVLLGVDPPPIQISPGFGNAPTPLSSAKPCFRNPQLPRC